MVADRHTRAAYEAIRATARLGHVVFTSHAREQMDLPDRDFTVNDVVGVLRRAENVWPDGPPANKWRVLGRDVDGGRRLVVVTLVDHRLTVITVVPDVPSDASR